MTHYLTDFVFLIMWFFENQSFFLFMLHLCLKSLIFLTLMPLLPLLSASNLDLCMNDDGHLRPLLSLICHLSLIKLFFHMMLQIRVLLFADLLESLNLLISMIFLICLLILLYHLFRFPFVIQRL